jgi:D-alanyl-D-alanine carboxypeptidase
MNSKTRLQLGKRTSFAARVLLATLTGSLVWASAAHAGGKPAAFVIDANTGNVISANNADEPRFPASLTKMMTLYVVFDLIEQGRLNYQTRIKISDKAASTPPSKLGLEEGDDIALIDAIKSLITRSANDIAVAIAEHIAGTEEKFAALMTQRARAIGMKASTFKNASGLPNENQVTTARDMITLGLRLHDDFPKHYALFSVREFRYAGRSHANHNTMLNGYEGTEGIKTGYTQASGFNLVASVKRNSKHVMGAVFGGASAASRNQTMRTLLNLALFKASSTKTRAPVAAAVAQARPVPEPRPAVRPALTQEVAQPAKPKSDWTAQVAAAPTATPTRTDTPPEAPTSAPKPREIIEIAKVRPVLVAPRPPRQAPVVVAAAPPAVVAPSTAEPEPVRQAAVTTPIEIRMPPLAASAVAQAPAPPITQVRTPAPAPSRAPVMSPATPIVASAPAAVPAPAPTPARGTPPSTFQQQAANLASGSSQPAYHLSGPPRATGPAAAGVEIQIGAFSSAAEADRQLGLARSKAADLIGAAPGVTQAASANGKSIWRARFGGFQSQQASNVCTELRRRQIDCLVVRSE